MNRPDRRRNRVVSFAASSLACLVISGCAVDQKKEVATYRKVLDEPKAPAYEYHAGDSLSLEAALLLANEYDEQLASSGEDYLQALIDKERQFAAFLPTIGFQPTMNLSETNIATVKPNPNPAAPANRKAVAVNERHVNLPISAPLTGSYNDLQRLSGRGELSPCRVTPPSSARRCCWICSRRPS